MSERADTYRVSVEEFSHFQRDGYVVVRDLVARHEIDELREHTELLMRGELPEQRVAVPSGRVAAISASQDPRAAAAGHLARREARSGSCACTCCTASSSCTSATCCTRACSTCWRR